MYISAESTPYQVSHVYICRVHIFMVMVVVLSGTFNNISVIPWWPVSLVEETVLPRKNTDLLQVTEKLFSHTPSHSN